MNHRWVASLMLYLGLSLGASAASAADLALQAALGEEIAVNGVLDVGETVTVSLLATYAPGEQAVNFQVDLVLSGDLPSFTPSALSPAPFGSPGDAACAVVSADRLRCFGNVDLVANSAGRITQADNPVALGSFQILATGANAPLQIAPVITFSEELVPDSKNPALLMGSALPLTLSGLDASGNVVNLTSGMLPLDSDGDGIPDDGNLSGTVGDAPCAPGQTSGCDDNCTFTVNPGQGDSGGVGSPADSSGTLPDGIGDVCQCGDVTGEGSVNGGDVTVIRRALLGLTPNPGFTAVDRCNVNGPVIATDGPDPDTVRDDCNGGDVTVMRRELLGLVPSSFVRNACGPGQP